MIRDVMPVFDYSVMVGMLTAHLRLSHYEDQNKLRVHVMFWPTRILILPEPNFHRLVKPTPTLDLGSHGLRNSSKL